MEDARVVCFCEGIQEEEAGEGSDVGVRATSSQELNKRILPAEESHGAARAAADWPVRRWPAEIAESCDQEPPARLLANQSAISSWPAAVAPCLRQLSIYLLRSTLDPKRPPTYIPYF
jgi:hypothetical protein